MNILGSTCSLRVGNFWRKSQPTERKVFLSQFKLRWKIIMQVLNTVKNVVRRSFQYSMFLQVRNCMKKKCDIWHDPPVSPGKCCNNTCSPRTELLNSLEKHSLMKNFSHIGIRQKPITASRKKGKLYVEEYFYFFAHVSDVRTFL